MTVTIHVSCRYCQQTEPVRKHGFGKTGEPRYYCRICQRSFQVSYRYNAHKQGVKEAIVDMALNGSGVRDTVRTLKVGINTVMGLHAGNLDFSAASNSGGCHINNRLCDVL